MPVSVGLPVSLSVSLQEDVVLPTVHAEQDFSQQGKMVQVLGVDRGHTGGAEGELVARQIALQIYKS